MKKETLNQLLISGTVGFTCDDRTRPADARRSQTDERRVPGWSV